MTGFVWKKSLSVKDSDFFEEEEIYYISSSDEAEFIIVSHYDENPQDFSPLILQSC